jgi:hypothetical protein
VHHIALVQLNERTTTWVNRGGDGHQAAAEAQALPFCGYWLYENNEPVPLTADHPAAIREALGLVGGNHGPAAWGTPANLTWPRRFGPG